MENDEQQETTIPERQIAPPSSTVRHIVQIEIHEGAERVATKAIVCFALTAAFIAFITSPAGDDFIKGSLWTLQRIMHLL